jgi:hypothetical protein
MQRRSVGRRLDAALLALSLRAQGPAVDFSRERVSGTPERSPAPPRLDLEADRWASLFELVVSQLERGERTTSIPDLMTAVRPFAGYRSSFLAFALSEPVERVEHARAALGVDGEAGLPTLPPLTSRELPARWRAGSLSAGEPRGEELAEDYEWAFEMWETISTPEAVYGVELDANDTCEYHGGEWSPLENRGISSRPYYENYGAPTHRKDATSPETVPPFGGDPGGEWLREHDPRNHAEGVASELEASLADAGVTLDEARGAFRKTGGRPTADLTVLRQRVALALREMWADDRRRDFMSEALGCDRKTLRRLMSKPPHDSYRWGCDSSRAHEAPARVLSYEPRGRPLR